MARAKSLGFLDCGEAEFQGEMKLYYRHVASLKDPPKTACQALQVRYLCSCSFIETCKMLLFFYSYHSCLQIFETRLTLQTEEVDAASRLNLNVCTYYSFRFAEGSGG